ncbi:hypothetical protein [Thalassospira sp.]|uniref:hypothetical protein n=1 Tax=Thalassospira sp. TaxID=1912094 RepID=UPI00262601DC|nr:hypothetical protein [Thalassospira sp.]MCH2273798.1 hypothetical protein [Thalassospira sp.]
MADEIKCLFEDSKLKNLISDLELPDTKKSLAAEAELAILWGLSKVAHIDPEPKLPNSARRPDCFSKDLFPSSPAVIEIRAVSDESFSGEQHMQRTANIVVNFCNFISKQSGEYLYFEFRNQSYYDKFHRFQRVRCIDPEFNLSDRWKLVLKKWILTSDGSNLRYVDGKTDMVISKKQNRVSKYARTFCSMPAVAYDVEQNPVFKALRSKARQLRGVQDGTLKCVFLFDAGCDILRRYDRQLGTLELTGQKIVQHAAEKLRLDLVVVLTPEAIDQPFGWPRRVLRWKLGCVDRRGVLGEEEYRRIKEMAAVLPVPRYEGYQARSLHGQGVFAPTNNRQTLGTTVNSGVGGMKVKFSTNVLLELLAGDIDSDEFRNRVFGGEKNLFKLAVDRNEHIKSIKKIDCGLDEDDDYVEISMEPDFKKIMPT